MTRFMWCSTRRIVSSNSSRILLISAPSSPTSSWLSPPAGSSSRSSRGRDTSARASSIRLRVPNGRAVTGRSAAVASPSEPSSSRAFDRAAASVRKRVVCAPTRTFSSVVIVLNSSTFWNVRAMPRRTIACAGTRSRSLPSKWSAPESGAYRRVITLKAVVLPAPFGPISPTIWPLSSSSESPSSARMPPSRRETCSRTRSATGPPTLRPAAPRSKHGSDNARMVELGDGIRRVTFALPLGIDHVHCYLVRGGDGWTIVDTGLGLPAIVERWRALLAELDGPVERIVITHLHPDHLGAAADLVELTGAPVFQGRLDHEESVRAWGPDRP